jgi:hypothetical protein
VIHHVLCCLAVTLLVVIAAVAVQGRDWCLVWTTMNFSTNTILTTGSNACVLDSTRTTDSACWVVLPVASDVNALAPMTGHCCSGWK